MKKKVSLLVVLFCALFAGQILADNIYLPTVAYRYGGRQKVEYIYNNDGYIVSAKLYEKQGESNEYTLVNSEVRDFHKLSNGEFVQTKAETGDHRQTAAYDSRDMRLWKQTERYIGSAWVLESRMEAVVNSNGIRTGIRKYNPNTKQMETLPYTFDNQGRLVRAEFYVGEEGDIPAVYTATWGSGRVYTGYSFSTDAVSQTYQNIVAVQNEEYFNPYDLVGVDDSDASGGAIDGLLLRPAYTDYEMHYVFCNGEMVYAGNTYVQQIVKDDANNEISEVVKIGNTEVQKTVYKQLANGGWSRTDYEQGVIRGQAITEYDTHGFLTRYYFVGKENGEITDQYEETYVIEYDAQGRPTKCTHTNGDNTPVVEETYAEWVVKGSTGIESIAAAKLSVYPNPATDYVVIENISAGSDITVNDLSGRTVYKQTAASNKETLSVASLAKGIYFVTVQTGNNKTVGKLIKK
jgi:hypothetical protein